MWFGCKSHITLVSALSLMCQEQCALRPLPLHLGSSEQFVLCSNCHSFEYLLPYFLFKFMMYAVFPVSIFTGFLAHCDYHVAALTLAYSSVVLPPGDASEGQIAEEPCDLPSMLLFPVPPSVFPVTHSERPPAMAILSRIMTVNPIKLHTMKLKYSLD